MTGIGSTLSAANAAAAIPTTEILAAAEDEISTAIAALFAGHAQAYQAASAQAAEFGNRFVQALTSGAGAYSSAEAASAASIADPLLAAINAPALALTGRPLIGNGANGTPGTGADGAAGCSAMAAPAALARRDPGRTAGPAARPDCSGPGVPAVPAAAHRPATAAPAGPGACCWATPGPAGPAGTAIS
ncbi:PE-PRGS family protein [Mycobacterium pseudoshottsii JCM 15466]|nr:PE-PRGS family protein [Mycobacterium pseudoshottsii JCM 15466]